MIFCYFIFLQQKVRDRLLFLELAKNFPNDPYKRIDEFLAAKLTNYLNSRSLRIKLLDDDSLNLARSSFTARKGGLGGGGGGGGGGKKGGYEGLLLAAAMMKSMMGAMALGGLALLAGKKLSSFFIL